ncbi:MAG: hypothetical protein QGI68_12855 [Pseudomonadales bacterium]|jgi:hypothetical protein|nr:hypothetical protein [Pseudomonadales bacterium]MDP7146341.1 hypothetical protein [Pseudomonadales bacterium]MDP7596442.1 hypothetical protein [Pseudomonadales bacterium]HJN52817.1 hypothetical protein [Pseudomonadales bacterium]|tara:strand:- start:5519 stop:6199 length:681 start_codon:yes stop_codon:yes gene_type:complete
MEGKLFLIRSLGGMACITMLSACVSSRIEENRQTVTGIEEGEALVILGRASYNELETEESFTNCMAKAMSRGDSPLALVTEKEFKDKLYPWFEPRTAPTSADDLTDLFARPGVAEQVSNTKVRYLAWIDGNTVTIDKGGSFSCTLSSFGGGCFGMSYWEEDASYQASIWDLKNLSTAGEISADANGTSYLAGLVVPIPIMARPGSAACKALAKQLKEFLIESPVES